MNAQDESGSPGGGAPSPRRLRVGPLRDLRRAPWLAVSGTALLTLVVAAGFAGAHDLTGRGSPAGSLARESARPALPDRPSPGPTGAPVTAPSPGVAPSPEPSATPRPGPSAEPSGDVLCRLPLDRGGTGAFLSVPAAGVQNSVVPYRQPVDDPAGHPRLPDGEDPVNVSYAWDLGRWLPVRQEWVAPDGSRYAYADRQGAIRVADARTGGDHPVNAERAWSMIAFRKEGIYAAPLSGGKAAGLWLVDPATGAARQLRPDGAWQYVTAEAAWAMASTAPALPPPAWSTPQDGLYGNTLVRLDLASGRLTTMYERTDTELRLIGVDAEGDPAIEDLAYMVSPLMIVTAPDRLLSAGSGAWVNATVDGDRTWFGENYGPSVWLEDQAGIRAMVGPGSGQVRIAGACR